MRTTALQFKRARRIMGWRQPRVAKEIGCSVQTISNLETGRTWSGRGSKLLTALYIRWGIIFEPSGNVYHRLDRP